MSDGARRLGDWPGRMVEVACRHCDRHGRYRRETLIARYGPDARMPDVLDRIAADCPRQQRQRERLVYCDRCGVYQVIGAQLGARTPPPLRSQAPEARFKGR